MAMLTRILLTGAEMLLGWLRKRHVEGGASGAKHVGTWLMSLVTVSWTVRPSHRHVEEEISCKHLGWSARRLITLSGTGATRCVIEDNTLLWTLWRTEEDGIVEH